MALGTMRHLSAAFHELHPGVKVTVLPSLESAGGIRAVANGALEVCVSARPLDEGERATRLVSHEYARTAFVIATGLKTPVDGLTLAEVADLYSGKTLVWRDGTPVRVVMRPRKDADYVYLQAMTPEMARALAAAEARAGMMSAATDDETADAIERVSGAISGTSLSLIVSEARKIKVLAIDGVQPSLATLAKGTYPYGRSVYLVLGQSPTRAAAAFVDFVASAKGAEILALTGNLVPKRP